MVERQTPVAEKSSTVDVLGQVVAQREAVVRRLAAVTSVMAVSSGKGGVGKSALTANLAAALATRSAAVGVVDADIHGPSAALMLGARGQRLEFASNGVRPAVGVADVRVMSMDLFLQDDETAVRWKHPGGLADDSYVWSGTLEANVLREFLADTEWGELDYLLVDMPPGADRFDTLLRLLPELSGTLMVTTPAKVAQLTVRRAIAAAQQAGARILGLVENMAGTTEGDGAGALAAESGIPLLARVPFDPMIAQSTDAGRPSVLTAPETPGAQSILRLADRLQEILSG